MGVRSGGLHVMSKEGVCHRQGFCGCTVTVSKETTACAILILILCQQDDCMSWRIVLDEHVCSRSNQSIATDC